MANEGPSWIGIGAQRCGTTWFTDLLVQHPQMDVAGGKKEHHWLYRYGLMRDWSPEALAEYRRTFSSDDVKLGEFTPYYLRASWICELATEAFPEDAPILVLLRDPIDRFASALRHEMAAAMRRYNKHLKATPKRQARINKHFPRPLPRMQQDAPARARRKTLFDRVALASSIWWVQGSPQGRPEAFHDKSWLRFVSSDATWGGMYAAQLDAWANTFPKERLMVIQYEKLRQDPQHHVDLVWKQLGLDPIPLTGVDERSSSSTKGERWDPKDHPHVVRALQQIYRPDAERLADGYDIDLALWKRTMSEV